MKELARGGADECVGSSYGSNRRFEEERPMRVTRVKRLIKYKEESLPQLRGVLWWD